MAGDGDGDEDRDRDEKIIVSFELAFYNDLFLAQMTWRDKVSVKYILTVIKLTWQGIGCISFGCASVKSLASSFGVVASREKSEKMEISVKKLCAVKKNFNS